MLSDVVLPILEDVAQCAGYGAVREDLIRYGESSVRRRLWRSLCDNPTRILTGGDNLPVRFAFCGLYRHDVADWIAAELRQRAETGGGRPSDDAPNLIASRP